MAAINLARIAYGSLLRKSTTYNTTNHLSAIQQAKTAENLIKCNYYMHQRIQAYTSEIDAKQEQEISQRVMKVCRTFKKLACSHLSPDSNFMTDLGLQPLEHVEVLTAMEDEFDFEIPDSDVKLLLRPKDIIKYIAESEDEYD